jgi:hypothetical protein
VSDPSLPHVPDMLGLEREAVQRLAHRSEQWARALEGPLESDDASVADQQSRDREQRLRRQIASLFTTAGSYRLVIEPQAAIEPFRGAAAHFEAVGSPYAHAVAVCAGDTQSEWVYTLDPSNLTPSARELVLLRLGWLNASSVKTHGQVRRALFAHMDAATSVGASEVGRLRLPLSATVRVLESVVVMLEDNSVRGLEAMSASVHDYLMRCHDLTALAMSDRFHWRNLMSGVLPVEPEAAALGAVVMASAFRRQGVGELLARLELPQAALVPLTVGLAIAQRTTEGT